MICPITQIEYNGNSKFVCFWDCGHIISEKATQELGQTKKCLVCDFVSEKIDLNMTDEMKKEKYQELLESKKKVKKCKVLPLLDDEIEPKIVKV